MNKKLYIVGIGPGAKELIHPAAYDAIKVCDVIIGGKRNLDLFRYLDKEMVTIGNNLDEIYCYIVDHISYLRIGVLVSGDPGLYSMMTFLKRKLEGIEMEVLPGISSLQYLCSKTYLNWNDMVITSVHGRQQSALLDMIAENAKVGIFTGGDCRPDTISRRLMDKNFAGIRITVGENLSYPDERIITGTPEEILELKFDSLSIMIVEHTENFRAPAKEWRFVTPGLPDSVFIRGDVPMTKEEVRAVSLSKLRLREDSIVYDIGAGTGSVSIECALQCKMGKVYAIERNTEALELIEKNKMKFGLENINVIGGEAPQAMEGLPKPDRVFVGGTGGNMGEILEWVKMQSDTVRVVVNSVTIESTYEAIESFESKGFSNIEVTNIAVSRSRTAGSKHLMQAMNPVYIVSGELGQE